MLSQPWLDLRSRVAAADRGERGSPKTVLLGPRNPRRGGFIHPGGLFQFLQAESAKRAPEHGGPFQAILPAEFLGGAQAISQAYR